MPIQAANLYALVSVAGADNSVGQLRRVSGAVDSAQSTLNKLGQNAQQVGRGVGQVAGGIVRIGTVATLAAVTAGIATAKIAADFQDSFAAVKKTVEGTPAELAAIDAGLRKLTTTIPVTFKSMATIASEAGALGVATKDIVKFSEAVARTSAATVGLDPFQASEAFGKLSTIFGLHGDRIDAVTGKVVSDYDRLGSALVALGNAGASSEADIIAVTKRFAAAGHIAGLSAAEVLGWSSALASLGPEAEAAGGALQRLFNRTARNIGLMDLKTKVGDNARKRVEAFARVTGMTVDDFAALYAKDASSAMQKFIQGLQGMDPFESSRELFQAGVINQRDILAIQAFSTRYDVLTKQIGIANEAWRKGTDLQTISEKRFDTLKSKAIEFKNQVLLGAAAVGEGMLPALTRAVGRLTGFVGSHMGDLRTLGVEIGAAIDDINWTQVQDGAERFVDILRAGFDLIRKIPVEVDLIVAGFLGLNKVSGGLLGAGIGNIVGGLGKGIANVILAGVSMVPGVGGAVGAVTATRVFVTNWPIGFGAGVPGLPVAGAAGASALSIVLPILAGGAFVAAVGMLVARVAHESYPEMFVDPTAPSGAMGSGTPHGFRQFDRHGNPINRTAPPVAPDTARVTDALDRSATYLGQFTGHMRDALDRSTTYLGRIADSTATAAEHLAVVAGIRVKGHVPSVAHLSHIGEAGDPFGFKHLKAFSLGEIPMSQMKSELKAHLEEINTEIKRASARGDTKTVAKLQQTKAGLEFLLGQVKANTFHAGERAYRGALAAAAAVDRTTTAVNLLPARIAALIPGRNVSGSPDERDERNAAQSPTRTGGGARRKAMGAVGIAKMATDWMFGEAGDEGVAIIRNPRYGNFRDRGGGGAEVLIRPQAIRLSLNGRDLVTAMVPYTAERRRRIA